MSHSGFVRHARAALAAATILGLFGHAASAAADFATAFDHYMAKDYDRARRLAKSDAAHGNPAA